MIRRQGHIWTGRTFALIFAISSNSVVLAIAQ